MYDLHASHYSASKVMRILIESLQRPIKDWRRPSGKRSTPIHCQFFWDEKTVRVLGLLLHAGSVPYWGKALSTWLNREGISRNRMLQYLSEFIGILPAQHHAYIDSQIEQKPHQDHRFPINSCAPRPWARVMASIWSTFEIQPRNKAEHGTVFTDRKTGFCRHTRLFHSYLVKKMRRNMRVCFGTPSLCIVNI